MTCRKLLSFAVALTFLNLFILSCVAAQVSLQDLEDGIRDIYNGRIESTRKLFQESEQANDEYARAVVGTIEELDLYQKFLRKYQFYARQVHCELFDLFKRAPPETFGWTRQVLDSYTEGINEREKRIQLLRKALRHRDSRKNLSCIQEEWNQHVATATEHLSKCSKQLSEIPGIPQIIDERFSFVSDPKRKTFSFENLIRNQDLFTQCQNWANKHKIIAACSALLLGAAAVSSGVGSISSAAIAHQSLMETHHKNLITHQDAVIAHEDAAMANLLTKANLIHQGALTSSETQVQIPGQAPIPLEGWDPAIVPSPSKSLSTGNRRLFQDQKKEDQKTVALTKPLKNRKELREKNRA